MEKYNGGENSGVFAYEILDDAVILQFTNDNFFYLYDYTKPGKVHVETMIELAKAGKGLTTYVNKNVRVNYKRKWKQLQKV